MFPCDVRTTLHPAQVVGSENAAFSTLLYHFSLPSAPGMFSQQTSRSAVMCGGIQCLSLWLSDGADFRFFAAVAFFIVFLVFIIFLVFFDMTVVQSLAILPGPSEVCGCLFGTVDFLSAGAVGV